MSTGLFKETNSITSASSRNLSPMICILVSLLLGIAALGITGTQRARQEGQTSADSSRGARSLSGSRNQEIGSRRSKVSESSLAVGVRGTLPLFSTPPTRTSEAGSNVSTERESEADPQAAGAQVTINFDDVAAFTEVGTRYPHVVFSSPGLSVHTFFSQNGDTPRSRPNTVTRGVMTFFGVQDNHSADFVADFPQPVDDLKFYVTSCDDLFTIALMDYYQNGTLKQANIAIGGCSPSHPPLLVDFQTPGIKNVSKIRIHNITDSMGLSFDDFSFTVPNATPTPTPTPTPAATPPAAPTNLRATPDEEAITLDWSPSTGAIGYFVNRLSDSSASQNSKAESAQLIVNGFIPVGTITNTTSFTDDGGGLGLSSDVTYTYVVTAFGTGGESLESQRVSKKPLPKPGCRPSATPRPNGGNPISDSHLGWNLSYTFSDQDGLVVRDVSLNGRRMAARLSVPYFRLDTLTEGKNSIPGRGELRPNGSSNPDGSFYSRLINYKTIKDSNRFLLEADYEIDHIPGTPKACLNITQQYEFFAEGFANPPDWPGPCEPSESVVNCTKFRPMVTYSFHSPDARDQLRSLNIPQRHHYEISGHTANSVGLFRDQDSLAASIYNRDGFYDRRNPLREEFWQQAIVKGQDAQKWDNMHQTWKFKVKEPSITTTGIFSRPWYVIGPGCLECVHNHWRWGKFQSYKPFGSGYPLLPPAPAGGSDQALDIAVVRWRQGEEHPTDYAKDLVQGESIADETSHYPVVFWFSPTGFKANDTFFWHTAWLNGTDPDMSAATIRLAAGEASNAVSPDGPVSINLGDVYRDGSNHVGTYDLSTLGPLPAGYAALDSTAYMMTTEAFASGPFTIGFSAASITDQAGFNNLRIFHAEPDPFDPEKPVLVDRTILAPDSPAPDFSGKRISSRSEDLGVFVIGNLVQVVPPSSDVANLAVTCIDSADPIVAGNQLTYTMTVANNGPQAAHEVALRDGLSPEAGYVSATASQGSCKEIDGTVYCNLGSIISGASATVTLVVKPIEGTATFPLEGKIISNSPSVTAKETDNELGNNSVTETTNILPNPNKAPTVSIAGPANGALFVGPTNITINANATDSDGAISKVEFFDNGNLIGQGTASGNNQYFITKQNASFGAHSLLALATDNGGRQNISNVANVIVNGPANLTITGPSAGALFGPGSNITVTASATHPSGIINKVEFFANGQSLGVGMLTSGSQYSFLWSNVPTAMYSIVAVATDGSGITTTSAPVNVTVGTPPTVTISSPVENTGFPTATNISVFAIAQSSVGSIVKVDFYASGVLIGTARDVGTDNYMVTWRHLADGSYTLTAVASDNLGLTSTSAPVHIVVNTVPASGQQIWFDDALPQGATKHGDTDVDWYWVDANPGSFSGTKSHQSRNFAQLNAPNSIHQHSFDGATTTLPVNLGDKVFTYVFLDINNMPREIMLQWKDANGWEHRAYWGANNINLGVDFGNARRYMGPLPKAGQWVRLEVPASAVGLEGSTLNGMAFTLDGGRATWDLAGKTTANAPPPPAPSANDFVWVDDAVPAGSVLETVADQWQWLPPHFSGQQGHRSFFTVNNGLGQFRSHAFRGATTPMMVQPGDVLFTYVYLDANNMPDELVLQWHDGTGWEHRAYWGQNFFDSGITGTESRRFMGGLPPGNQWVRLEIPASYVGLEGKAVSGMAFGFYSTKDHAGINWDYAGKSSQLTITPLPLTSITPLWRLVNTKDGPNKTAYADFTNDQLGPSNYEAKSLEGYVHPNQAAGTVPLYRFVDFKNKYQYSSCRTCSTWTYDGIAFYLYPDSSTPGTVPLYQFHYSESFMYSINFDDSERYRLNMTLDGVIGYVNATNLVAPGAPSYLYWDSVWLRWKDNSANETGFRIERNDGNAWNQIATVPTNTTFFKVGIEWSSSYFRVRATNSVGESASSNSTCLCWLESFGDPNTAPTLYIVSPPDSGVVIPEFAVAVNVFDKDGAGTIDKVELYSDGAKLSDLHEAPYWYVWNNAPPGLHTLTAVATDTNGAATTSSPVSITVGGSNVPPAISVTAPTNGAVFNAPATVNISASASDSNGSISKVEFFQGPTKLGEDATTPYSFNWTNVGAGSYSLTATATDNLGATSTSVAVNINVNGSNAPPTVSITAPTNGTVFTAPASFNINASAFDADGSISKVEFFQWGTKLGEVNTAPYSFSWTNVPAGNYALTAVATDDRGASATSGTVNVTVTQPAPPSDYRAYTDFSNVQGDRNWYYLESTGTQMTFDEANNRWQGSGASSLLFNYGGQPGQTVDAVRQWRAPQAGTVRITGNAADTNGICGDGVVVFIKKGAQVLWQQIIENANNTGFTYDLNTTVAVGDQINFIINKRSLNNGCDSTRFDSSISYTSVSNQSPVANAGGPYSGTAGTAVQFNGSSAYDPDGTIASYSWTFGDGGSGTGTAPSHIYSAAGTYPATLTVTDNSGAQSSANATVTIGNSNQLPVANAGGPYSGTVGTAIQFNGSGSSDPDGTIVSYAWNFGDGGTGSGATPVHTYTAVGNYIASLTVTDNGGGQSGVNAAVTVGSLPSSTEIVFASNRDGISQLYRMNTDGSGQVRLTNNSANDESPRWSPNNARIVFQSDRANPFSGVADIYVMNADGSGQTRLTTDVADDGAPVWSPDGTKIAFQSARNGVNYQVYVMNADGSGQVNISNSSANDGQPSWSPDATKIAFASDRDHPAIASIYVMNANGSNQTRLTFSGSQAKDEQPIWSPDGARIAFVSTRDSILVTWQETDDDGLVLVKTKALSNKEVYLMNADGTGQVRLTNTLESDDSPVWSRDGAKLLFRSDRERECCDPGAQIWVMNADGSNQSNLSNNGFGDYGPSW